MWVNFFFFFVVFFFFFNDTATTEIYTLSLHDALPICLHSAGTKGWNEQGKTCTGPTCRPRSMTMCHICCVFEQSQRMETFISCYRPDRSWSKFNTDLTLFQIRSKLNIFIYKTSTISFVWKLKSHIANYGISNEIIKDQGKQFFANEFPIKWSKI